jgi:hypothetical protein
MIFFVLSGVILGLMNSRLGAESLPAIDPSIQKFIDQGETETAIQRIEDKLGEPLPEAELTRYHLLAARMYEDTFHDLIQASKHYLAALPHLVEPEKSLIQQRIHDISDLFSYELERKEYQEILTVLEQGYYQGAIFRIEYQRKRVQAPALKLDYCLLLAQIQEKNMGDPRTALEELRKFAALYAQYTREHPALIPEFQTKANQAKADATRLDQYLARYREAFTILDGVKQIRRDKNKREEIRQLNFLVTHYPDFIGIADAYTYLARHCYEERRWKDAAQAYAKLDALKKGGMLEIYKREMQQSRINYQKSLIYNSLLLILALVGGLFFQLRAWRFWSVNYARMAGQTMLLYVALFILICCGLSQRQPIALKSVALIPDSRWPTPVYRWFNPFVFTQQQTLLFAGLSILALIIVLGLAPAYQQIRRRYIRRLLSITLPLLVMSLALVCFATTYFYEGYSIRGSLALKVDFFDVIKSAPTRFTGLSQPIDNYRNYLRLAEEDLQKRLNNRKNFEENQKKLNEKLQRQEEIKKAQLKKSTSSQTPEKP